MSGIAIRTLPPERWREYKELRLTALKGDPAAFGSSYEEELEKPQTEWENRIRNVLFAEHEGIPVGMVVCGFETRLKTRHVAHIFGMFVRGEYRGRGIGSLLMDEALRNIRKNQDIVKVTLSVNPLQKEAVELYRKYGFVPVGTLRRELRVSDAFSDMLVMELLL